MNCVDHSSYYIIPDDNMAFRQLQQEFEDLSAPKVSDLDVESDFLPRLAKVRADEREMPEWLSEMGEEDWVAAIPTDSNNSSLSSSPTHPASHAKLQGSEQQPACARQKRHYRKKNSHQPQRWSAQEEAIFLSGLRLHSSGHQDGACRLGPGGARILAEMIGSRTAAQVRSHAQKHFKRLHKTEMQ